MRGFNYLALINMIRVIDMAIKMVVLSIKLPIEDFSSKTSAGVTQGQELTILFGLL